MFFRKTIRMSNSLPVARKPWIAASLSMLCCGLGQIYCGRVARGLVMYSVAMMLGPLVVLTVLLGSSTFGLIVFLASLLAVLAVYLWSISDARRLARGLAGREFQPQEYHRPIVYWLMSLTSLPYALGLAVFLRTNVVEAFYIPSSSMAPTFVYGDCILANKLGIGSRTLHRGDLVIFRYSANRQQRFVKRIVALPGETVALRQGQLLINGQPLPREPIATHDTPQGTVQACYETNGDRKYKIFLSDADEQADFPEQTVPDGAYFVLGDHRGNSLDSRKFHAVSHGEMVGVVAYLYRPADTWQRFGVVE
jgi:signal peptidase I